MITVYEPFEKNFTHNGLGALTDAIKCEVFEEGNAAFEIELEHPIDSLGKWKLIEQFNIVKCHTPKYGYQPFRIVSKKKLNRRIIAKARHLFYDLLDNFLEDVRPTEQNGAGALNWILSNTQFEHNFMGISDINRSSSASYVRRNPVEALLGNDDNSYVNRWGGELERDIFTIKILAQAGTYRGGTIAYGKNLTGFEENSDYSNVVTRLLLTGLNENDTVLYLPEKYIDSPYINTFPNPKIKHIHYSDLKVNPEEGITEDVIYEALRAEAERLFNEEKIDIPPTNYTVSFLELGDTEEYKAVKGMERYYLYDIVNIVHSKLNVALASKIISYKYNAISKKYIQLELGNTKANFASSNLDTKKKINDVSKGVEETKSNFQKAIEKATDLITGYTGGYFRQINGDHIWMDTEDANTAQQILRVNGNGIGFSSTGINGPYTSAWTLDGTLNMENINVINLVADLIRGGTLRMGGLDNTNGVIELFDQAGNLISRQDKEGMTVYAMDGSYVKLNAEEGFAGYDNRNNKVFWADRDEFHMKKAVVENEVTLGGIAKIIPINNSTMKGIAIVAL